MGGLLEALINALSGGGGGDGQSEGGSASGLGGSTSNFITSILGQSRGRVEEDLRRGEEPYRDGDAFSKLWLGGSGLMEELLARGEAGVPDFNQGIGINNAESWMKYITPRRVGATTTQQTRDAIKYELFRRSWERRREEERGRWRR